MASIIFPTGAKSNLHDVKACLLEPKNWSNFKFIEGDIRDSSQCDDLCAGADYILHQAALGSVPRSIVDPLETNASNVSGFLNMIRAARDAKASRFVYAASSSTYGDHPDLPKREDAIGAPLSPYAVTKLVNELYADVFYRCYGFQSVGLRYFNVFGRRQDPEGAYAAVIPKFMSALISGSEITINGDGTTSRDFCYIDNVVQANILAACEPIEMTDSQIYNVAVGDRTSLNDLVLYLTDALQLLSPNILQPNVKHGPFRKGDVLHSMADITKIVSNLGYSPTHSVKDGLNEAAAWYLDSHGLAS